MHRLIPLIAMLALAACQTFPEKHAIETSRAYALPKDAVWADVMAWLRARPFSIERADEASGQILAQAIYPGGSGGQADCGRDDSSPPIERRQRVTIQLLPAGTGTSVNVVSQVHEYRRSGWDWSTITMECYSTGVFEAELLGTIGQ